MNSTHPPRYQTLSTYLRSRFGEKVQKIPLDAGFNCPNRDGTISRVGCAFCNPSGSGSGLLAKGMNLATQWDYWRKQFLESSKTKLFMAYLQSYSNTHGPLERIQTVLNQLQGLPSLAGLSLGTRPDCLDQDKLALIAAFPAPEIHLELGLQSANDQTLERIGRGHNAACFASATKQAAELGLKVVAHVIAGLPGENRDDFLTTIDFVNQLPVHGIKFHNLVVCKNTRLAQWWAQGKYRALTLENYAETAALAVARLRPDVVIHRLNSDPQLGELFAPDWATEKQTVLIAINAEMKSRAIWQGCDKPSGQ